MPEPTYTLAPDGVFETVNGEGYFLGVRQVFVRFAYCSVGCSQCDTNYTPGEVVGLAELVRRVTATASPRVDWTWLTGGDPCDRRGLGVLVDRLQKAAGFRVALATAGHREADLDGWAVHCGRATGGVDFLSVSPHDFGRWSVRSGSQVNLVPGLNGLDLDDAVDLDFSRFSDRWVTPNSAEPGSVRKCLDFQRCRPDFRIGCQAHLTWGVP